MENGVCNPPENPRGPFSEILSPPTILKSGDTVVPMKRGGDAWCFYSIAARLQSQNKESDCDNTVTEGELILLCPQHLAQD